MRPDHRRRLGRPGDGRPGWPACQSVAGRLGRGPAGPATRRYLLACGTYGRRLESAWSNGKPAYRCRPATPAPLAPARTGRRTCTCARTRSCPGWPPWPSCTRTAAIPRRAGNGQRPVTASAQAADLIDRLQPADVTLIYDPATRALPARTGSPAWKTSPICHRRRHPRPGRDQDSVLMICKPWHGGVRANAGRGGGAPGREPYGRTGPQPVSTTRVGGPSAPRHRRPHAPAGRAPRSSTAR